MRTLYRPFIKPGDRVFDVGAHLGDRTAAFAALGGRVVAVEPQPQFQRWLRRLVGHKANVTIVPKALGECEGYAELALSYAHPTVASLAAGWRDRLQKTAPGFRKVRWEQTITVPVTTLDALVRRYGEPAFCKIDVEGFEPQVLAGLSYPVPALSFEFITGTLDQTRLCLAELYRLGDYEFNAIGGEDRRYLWPHWRTPGQIQQWLDDGVDGIASGDLYARLIRAAGARPVPQ